MADFRRVTEYFDRLQNVDGLDRYKTWLKKTREHLAVNWDSNHGYKTNPKDWSELLIQEMDRALLESPPQTNVPEAYQEVVDRAREVVGLVREKRIAELKSRDVVRIDFRPGLDVTTDPRFGYGGEAETSDISKDGQVCPQIEPGSAGYTNTRARSSIYRKFRYTG